MCVTLRSSVFWCFLNSYIKDYVQFHDSPAPLQVYPNIKQKEKEKKVIKKNSN